METKKFLKLEAKDQVVLNMVAQGIPSEIWPFPPELEKLPAPVVYDVIEPPKRRDSADPQIRVTPAEGEEQHGKFYVKPYQVLRVATDADKDKTPAEEVELTALDKELFQLTPGQFVELICDYKWLPSHDRRVSVRDRYDKWDKDDTKKTGISKLGGMQALQAYRTSVCERLLAEVAVYTMEYSKGRRRAQVAKDDDMTKAEKDAYIRAAAALVGNAPGSTSPSSDVDINTQGDGTEFAVCLFNAIFRLRHRDVEPGIVYDVNLYGKDFLPSFDNWPVREQGHVPKNFRPTFDHKFSDYSNEIEDVLNQLSNAFAKLRRYSPSPQWAALAKVMQKTYMIGHCFDEGELNHLTWAKWIAVSHQAAIAPGAIKEIILDGEDSDVAVEAYLKQLAKDDPAGLMTVQNKLYEYHLRKEVEPAREKFTLLKFKSAHIKADAIDKVKADAIDEAYVELRQVMSKSLYFANEAYVTAGAVLQVVGGKQIMSRGVDDLGHKKKSYHNIAYTPHELATSAVDQLADIHKEASRHFAEEGKHDDVGGALLPCGKYLHRLLNAVKHFYKLLEPTLHLSAYPQPKDYPSKGFPATVFVDLKTWDTFRKVGFGLEALKKVNSVAPAEGSNVNSDVMLILHKYFYAPENEASILLTRANGEKSVLAKAAFNHLSTKFVITDKKIKLTQDNELSNTPFEILRALNFFTFFDRLVGEMLGDYNIFYDNVNKRIPFQNEYGTLKAEANDFLQLSQEEDEDGYDFGPEAYTGQGSISTDGSVSVNGELPVAASEPG